MTTEQKLLSEENKIIPDNYTSKLGDVLTLCKAPAKA